jgi:hypothetical protein
VDDPRPADLATNAGVLRYLGQGLAVSDVTVAAPPPDVDRLRLGAHPDIVERLWDVLAAALPDGSRALVAGGPALVDPTSGIVLAVALGTQYALRLTGAGLEAARAGDYATRHAFRSVGRTLDLAETFGPGWVFGDWNAEEGTWLAETQRAANL